MKTFLSACLFIASQHAFACSPPPDGTYIQPYEIGFILNSDLVLEALRSAGAKDIKSVVSDKNRYTISASNGCQISVQPIYKAPDHNGDCPALVSLKVNPVVC